MAIKNKTSLTTTNNANITDPLNKQNTAARVREVTQDLIDSSLNLLDAQIESLKLSATSTTNSGTRAVAAASTGGNITSVTNAGLFATDSSTANGNQSAAVGADNGTVSGSNSIVSGDTNSVAGSQSFSTGAGNVVIASNSMVSGTGNNVQGNSNIVTGDNHGVNTNNSIIAGKRVVTQYDGQIATGTVDSGDQSFSVSGLIPIATMSNDVIPQEFEQFIKMPTDTCAMRLDISVVVQNKISGDAKELSMLVLVKMVGGTLSIVGSPSPSSTYADGSMSSATISNINIVGDSVHIEVTGVMGQQLLWGGCVKFDVVRN